MSEIKYPFHPIMGPETIVLSQEPQTGAIYFTTDTRKVYLDVNDNKVPVGGNVGLFYGTMKPLSPPADGQEEFEFSITDIVGNEDGLNMLQPNVDDLILNSDGCFYKVLSSYGVDVDTTLITKKLTIAGSGGGGGGSSSDPSSLAGMGLSRLRSDNGNTVLYQASCPISFAVKVTDDLGDPQTGAVGTYDLYIDNVKKESGPVTGCTVETAISDFGKLNIDTVIKEELNTIDVGKYLPLKSNITVKICVTSTDGYVSTRTVNVSTTDMTLTWNYDETTLNEHSITNKTMDLNWSVTGNIEKTTHIIIDDDIDNEIVVTSSRTDETYSINFVERNLTHGAHKFEMYVTANVGAGVARTPSIYKNVIVVEENSLTTIISVGLFEKKLTQYNTIKIPILIYDPMNTGGTAIVSLRENGVVKDKWENVQNLDATRYWSYTPTIEGDIVLSVQCSGVEKSMVVSVQSLNIDVSEVEGYAFKFKANEFASNDNVQSWISNGIFAQFSDNFDWINGGIDDEIDENGNNRQFFKIKAGSSMQIRYSLFKESAKANGKTIKVIFKVTNCRDYDANFLNCKIDKKIAYVINDEGMEKFFNIENGTVLTKSNSVQVLNNAVAMVSPTEEEFDLTSKTSRENFDEKYVLIEGKIYQCSIEEVENFDKDNPVYYAQFFDVEVRESFEGLMLNAQSASYKSRNQTITTQYCEDQYIELELDISPRDKNSTGVFTDVKNYITFWVDGIPSGFVVYDGSDEFILSGDPVINIGSADCDVQIDTIKVYEKHLSDTQHLKNFISDASGATEMISRFNRNDILDERGEISPSLLAIKNPDCLVHVYEIDRMTKTKGDPIDGCLYAQYKGSDQAILSAENVTIKVQGTSSEKYVEAAANLDTSFNNGFTDASGNQIDGWSMTPGAIPINFTCTKVNVASCENANNAMNQEWYNMFQPYKTLVRCKNENARDTMQFTNGVIFIKDKNEKFVTTGTYDSKDNNVFGDTVGYIENPYPKMYSLGQMGNSKENIQVCHDTENPLECCVEVGDNQEPQQWMVDYNYSDGDIDDGEEYYGFRYPKKLKGVASDRAQAMRDAWRRLVTWMAQSNPQPKYQEHTATTEDEYLSFAKNQKQNKINKVYILNETGTDYEEIAGFDNNITTYYTETEHVYGYTNLPFGNDDNGNQITYSFDPYVFDGYKADETLQSTYEPLIAGCTVSAYATRKTIWDYEVDENGDPVYDDETGLPVKVPGSARVEDVPYTHDTYEYRMAKMLSECEEYLCMDSVIYHYLFIERHCMIDNVAKNTFWSTEDGEVWNLTKNYDNDTADGNDNNGKFTRTYGMEPMDKLNRNTYVFNAHQSVWFNFIGGLQEACEHMYKQLENKVVKVDNRNLKLWSKDDYLWFFNKWQSKIPERCWIEDYYRKYHRPYEVYNNTMFNSMMEGGQKKHQRAQYETYQEIYMASKYFGTTCSGSYSIIRGNGRDLMGYRLPVTTYSDCYIHAHVGSAKSVQRVKRNEVNYLTCPTDNINNATVYFYPINTFSTLGSAEPGGGRVGAYEPEQVTFSGAHKLRELVISTQDDTSLDNDTLKSDLAVNNNKLLEKLYVANLTGYTSNLNLTNCPNLVELDATNSTFTSISLAPGAPTKKIKLYKPTGLEFSDLRNIEELTIAGYENLSILNLNNIDTSPGVNSKALTTNSIALQNYKLTKVLWTINNATEITGNKINLLESLLTKNTVDSGYGPELVENSLTGQLTITSDGYNNGSAGALAIYESYSKAQPIYERVIYANEKDFNDDTRKKFIKNGDEYEEVLQYTTHQEYYIEKLLAKYPNLDIKFTGNNATLYTVYIHDGDGNVFWSRKAAPNDIVDADFLRYGPKGSFKSSDLYKSNTEEYTYTFLNKWTVKTETASGQLVETNVIDNAEPVGVSITSNIHLYPVFKEDIRNYTVYVKSKHPETGRVEELKAGQYPYGTPLEDVLPETLPYADATNLKELQVYDFIGYSLVENGISPVSKNYKVNSDATLWAIFKLEANARAVVHPEWFTAVGYEYSESADIAYRGAKGVILAPKYKLKGKITIPATIEFEGKTENVIAIRNFRKELGNEISHVFMEEGKTNKLYYIAEKTFSDSDSLVHFDFDRCAVRFVGQYAFQKCKNLVYKGSIGEQLFATGAYAFNQAFTTNEVMTIKIPPSLEIVQAHSFSNLGHKPGCDLLIGLQDNLSLLTLQENVTTSFSQNDNTKFTKIEFYSKNYDAGNQTVLNALSSAVRESGDISIT